MNKKKLALVFKRCEFTLGKYHIIKPLRPLRKTSASIAEKNLCKYR